MSDLYHLQDVTHRYRERTILTIPSLTLQQGECFALIGASGAGKSTLLRLLALVETPTQGAVNIRLGEQWYDRHHLPLLQRRKIGMVFQSPIMLTRSVLENLAYGLRIRGEKIVKAHLMEMLEALQLAHVSNAPAHTLSGGEQKRLALGRVMILKTEVILLDEPTANLDPANIAIIEAMLRNQQRTIIIITHNFFQARRLADRVGFLHNGELLEVEQTDRFFNQPQHPLTRSFLSGELLF